MSPGTFLQRSSVNSECELLVVDHRLPVPRLCREKPSTLNLKQHFPEQVIIAEQHLSLVLFLGIAGVVRIKFLQVPSLDAD